MFSKKHDSQNHEKKQSKKQQQQQQQQQQQPALITTQPVVNTHTVNLQKVKHVDQPKQPLEPCKKQAKMSSSIHLPPPSIPPPVPPSHAPDLNQAHIINHKQHNDNIKKKTAENSRIEAYFNSNYYYYQKQQQPQQQQFVQKPLMEQINSLSSSSTSSSSPSSSSPSNAAHVVEEEEARQKSNQIQNDEHSINSLESMVDFDDAHRYTHHHGNFNSNNNGEFVAKMSNVTTCNDSVDNVTVILTTNANNDQGNTSMINHLTDVTTSLNRTDADIESMVKSTMNNFCDVKDFNDDELSVDFSIEKSTNDDLVTLNNLNESLVMEQLKKRFSKNKIYTYIGDILIAMNPLKAISIYGKKVSDCYKASENVRDKLPPHVYATAEQCFREMIRTQQSQCILISGESGSGKTETCKYLVQHLLNRTKPLEFCLNSKIQEVNSLLEAFGNAKTRINDNSSRFGKYLEIYFELDGTVVGAKFKEYLLEKSRIVYQNEYESTFHIFYLLFAGLTAEEKLRYGLLRSPKKYRFMSNTNVENCLSNENEERFLFIKQSLNTIGFLPEDVENMVKILVSILLIGEIQFVQKKGNNNDAVQVKNMEFIDNVCELLDMDTVELSDALISDVQVTRGEEIKRERNMVQACDVRDALAKAFYGRLFSWIVNQINHHIQPAEGVISSYSIGLLDIFGFENFERNSFEQMCINLANEQLHQLFTKYIFKLEIQECLDEQIELTNSDLITYQDNQIILDLFLEKRHGIFALLDEESRFPKATDQSLAIKLHQTLGSIYPEVYVPPKNGGTSFHIVHYAGQVLYNVEGFLEKNRDFLPNNLFYAARNSNNFLVQELFQCKLTRKGTIAPSDRQSRVRKSVANTFGDLDKPETQSSSQMSDMTTMTTTTTATNNETTSNKIMENLNLNKVRFTVTVSTSSSTISSQQSNGHFSIKNKDDLRNSINSQANGNNQYASDKALPLTVACHFKNSLHELIEKINKCKSYFIRCIKPSPNQENVFINDFVVKQLRYCSLMHVCTIRKCGFPYRINFEEFLKWYRAIEICVIKLNGGGGGGGGSSKWPCESKDHNNNNNNNSAVSDNENLQKCLKCLEHAKITNYKVGKTKLFLRYWHIDIFNSIAKQLETKVLIAQKIVRGWLVRNRIKKMQQHEAEKFLKHINASSVNLTTKLNSQKSFILSQDELNINEDDYLIVDRTNGNDVRIKLNDSSRSSIDFHPNLRPQQILDDKFKSTTDLISSNWPDMNEINSALEQFDIMLQEYENDSEFKENKLQNGSSNNFHKFNQINKIQITYTNNNNNHNNSNLSGNGYVAHIGANHGNITKSASSFMSQNNASNNNNKISPTSVYHLVNNNNNKNDNTLKKRNALVAFEFKTLLDKVALPPSPVPAPANTTFDDERYINDDLPSPPFIYNDNQFFDLTANSHNHSPACLSSSSSSSSSASSSPTSSTSSSPSSTSASSHLHHHHHHQNHSSRHYQNTANLLPYNNPNSTAAGHHHHHRHHHHHHNHNHNQPQQGHQQRQMNKTITVRTVSPSQVIYQNHVNLKSMSNKNLLSEMNPPDYASLNHHQSMVNGSLVTTAAVAPSSSSSPPPNQITNLRSKSQIIASTTNHPTTATNNKRDGDCMPPVIINEIDNQIILTGKNIPSTNINNSNMSTSSISVTNTTGNNLQVGSSISSTSTTSANQAGNHHQPNVASVTIWREELNAKNNVQEQIKKQTELSQKLEDSKKNIPEWKKNLIKQKEMKKITNNSPINNTNLYTSNQTPETPELMKHNMFIKKGLAANSQFNKH